jgi:hypothetical protein
MTTWTPEPRLDRLPHDHILQADHVAGCKACESVDPYHRTTYYFHTVYRI